jgi:DNA-binding response OmpR family regulator
MKPADGKRGPFVAEQDNAGAPLPERRCSPRASDKLLIVDADASRWCTRTLQGVSLASDAAGFQRHITSGRSWDCALVASGLGSLSTTEVLERLCASNTALAVLLLNGLGRQPAIELAPLLDELVRTVASGRSSAPLLPNVTAARIEERASSGTLRQSSSQGHVLSRSQRTLDGLAMPPLTRGETRLLEFLGAHPHRWFSTYKLAVAAYCRHDAGARQLVWKYASTLRRKLDGAGCDLLQACRRRGYTCVAPITVVD